jgi:WD40 repeat protein
MTIILKSEPTRSRTLKGHKDIVTSIDFHPCPSVLGSIRKKRDFLQQIISSSVDGLVHVWNYPQATSSSSSKEEARLYKFHGHQGCVYKVKYSPTGHLLASFSADNTCRLWVPRVHGDSILLRGHQAPVKDVDFGQTPHLGTTSESLLLTCSDDKTLKVWNLPSKSFRSSLLAHTNWVNSCKFSPHTVSIAASGSDDGTIRTWDIESSKNLVTYSTNADAVRNIVFHPSGSLLAASLKNGAVEMYDLRCDSLVHTFYGLEESIQCSGGLCFHPSGNHLMTGFVNFLNESSSSIEEGFHLWDIRTTSRMIFSLIHSEKMSHHNIERNSLKLHTMNLSCCSFSNDGLEFATASNGKDVCVWQSNDFNNWDGEVYRHSLTSQQQSDKKSDMPAAVEDYHYCTNTVQPPPSPIDGYKQQDQVNNDTKLIGNHKNGASSVTQSRHSIKSTQQEIAQHQNNSPSRTLSEIPEHLQQIHKRLDILTEMIVLLDKRLSMQEDTVMKLTTATRK